MGDRVSVAFTDSDEPDAEQSVALFNHWGGMAFVKDAMLYAKQLVLDVKSGEVKPHYPLGRFEPGTVMVDFLREIGDPDNGYYNGTHIESSLYLGKDANDGDNSDNGHYIVVINEKGAHWHPSSVPEVDA